MIRKFYDSYNGSAVNIRNLITNEGIALDANAKLDDGIAGEISKTENGYQIKVNGEDQDFWKRFTMAHELGHYVFHRHLIGDGVDDNRVYFSTDDGNYSKNDNVTAVHEMQAHIFACNVLVPKDALRDYINRYVEDKEHLKSPPEHFQVPFGVIKWWLALDENEFDVPDDNSP